MASNAVFRISLILNWFIVAKSLVPLGAGIPLFVDYSSLFSNETWGIEGSAREPENITNPKKMEFNHHVQLSDSPDVKLSWNFNENNITFKVSAPTSGWIALGITHEEIGMANADFAVMSNINGTLNLYDMHGDLNGDYVVDKSQDLVPIHSWESEFKTFAIFCRHLVNCDDDDADVTPDTLRIIWAYGESDLDEAPVTGEMMNAETGSMNIKLLNPTLPPLNSFNPDVKTLEVKAPNVRVKSGEQRYCQAFRFSGRTMKHHIIQFDAMITNEFNVRQIIVRECSGTLQNLEVTPTSDYDCEKMDVSITCKTVVFSWVMGMSRFTYPEDTGYPIGLSLNYYVMEISYINPRAQDLKDSSGLKISYTPILRNYNSGVMTTGSLVRDSQIIPPRSPNFVVQGHCTKDCISRGLARTREVTIFAVLMKTQNTGRKMKIRHFRGGEELEPIAQDNRIDSTQQGTQIVARGVKLLSGDNLIIECTYDTLDRNEITYVNNSKGGESCLAYLSYYPRITNLIGCETAPTEKVIMDTVGAERLDDMKKSVEKFEWTYEKTIDYNERILNSQVYVHCGDTMLQDPQPVPSIKKLFVEEEMCPGKKPRSYAISRHGFFSSFFSAFLIFIALCATP